MRVCTSCRRLLAADAGRCPTDGAPYEDVRTLPTGVRIGSYRIDRVLGEGGMGFVYEATHEVLNRRSAIKMLRPELTKLKDIVTRFLNEAKAVNLIDHQNIVNVYDYGDGLDGSVYFVMEFLEGETLDDLMHRRRPMSVPLLLHVFGQMSKALKAAHDKKIVHRDLKPGNVFITTREDNPHFVKLLDFGIAQLRGEGAVQGLTIAGMVMGTPQYMSPEQISGDPVDARSDVWAMGVMMYRAATGQAPFKGEEFVHIADKVLNHPPPPAGELVQMPASLSALIMSCLERRPDARCPSVAALLAGIERVKQEARLTDDAILAAVRAESNAQIMGLPGLPPREPTQGSLAQSSPRYQGAPDLTAQLAAAQRQQPGAAPRRKSRLGLYITLGAILGGLGSAAFVLLDRDSGGRDSGGRDSGGRAPEGSGSGGSGSAVAARPPDRVGSAGSSGSAGRALPTEPRARAEYVLRGAIESGALDEGKLAIDALARARAKAGAGLLYLALQGQPDLRREAARALAELALPEAAPKVRDALSASGDKLKVDLAAELFRLGDKDARAILKRATEDPGKRLVAALALADAGDAAGKAVLTEILESSPAGADNWRRAAGGLLKLGDEGAKKLLQAELSQSKAVRAVSAARQLAQAGDAAAKEQLARMAGDEGFDRPGEAALALARLGDPRALSWVDRGLKSPDAEERKNALAICGTLKEGATAHSGAIAKLATDDPDLGVRLTAEAVLLGL